MKKLLNTTTRPFALYSLLVLVVSIPVYFFIINDIWQEEIDQQHHLTRNKIEKELNALNKNEVPVVVEQFNSLSLGSKITPLIVNEIAEDSIYSYNRFDLYHNEEERFRTLSTKINIHGKPYLLVIETNIEESEETILAIALVTFTFFIILLFGFFYLNRTLSKKIWLPFYNTLRELKEFDLSNEKAIVLEKTNISEFEELNNALNKLIIQNISTFKQQKEFTENASHELQTPLAILKSQIDLLLQDGALTQEQSEKIASLNIPLSRASRINKNLLLLAKIENQKFSATTEILSVNELIDESIEFIMPQMDSKEIKVGKNFMDIISVEANKILLETLLLNLILNAARHNVERGFLDIHLNNKQLIISNTGSHPLKSDALFKRFASASLSSPGSGLGLAIVREICQRYHWPLAYKFENDRHIFSVQF